MVCNKHKITTIQIRVKLTHSSENGEGFFVGLRVVLLCSRQRSRCEGDRVFGAVRKHVQHHGPDARGRAGLKWVSAKSEAMCPLTISKAWWQAAVHLQAVPF